MLKRVNIYTHNLKSNEISRASIPIFFLDRYTVHNGIVVGLEFINSDRRIVDYNSFKKNGDISQSEFLDIDSFFIGEFEKQLIFEEEYKKQILENPHIVVFASKRDANHRIREIVPVYDYNAERFSLVNNEEALLKIYRMKIGRDLKK